MATLPWGPGRHQVLQQLATGSGAQKAGAESGSSPTGGTHGVGLTLPMPQTRLTQDTQSDLFQGKFPRSPTAKALCFSLGFSEGLGSFFFLNFETRGSDRIRFARAMATFPSPRSESSFACPSPPQCRLTQGTQVSFPAFLRWWGWPSMSPKRFSSIFLRKRGTEYKLNL